MARRSIAASRGSVYSPGGVSALRKAIALHEAHMDGSEPTSKASQQRLMSLLKTALKGVMGK